MFTDGILVPQTADLIVNVYAFLQHWNRLLQLRGQELLLQLHEMKNQSCRGNWAMGYVLKNKESSVATCWVKMGIHAECEPSGVIFIFMILTLDCFRFTKNIELVDFNCFAIK